MSEPPKPPLTSPWKAESAARPAGGITGGRAQTTVAAGQGPDRVLFDTSSTVRPSSDAGSEPPAEEVEIADPATTLARPHRSTLSPSTPCDDGASAVSLSNARPSAPLLDWNVELQRIVSSDDPAAIAREQHEAGVDGREARAVISAARADLEARLARTRLAVKRLRDLEAELEGQEQG